MKRETKRVAEINQVDSLDRLAKDLNFLNCQKYKALRKHLANFGKLRFLFFSIGIIFLFSAAVKDSTAADITAAKVLELTNISRGEKSEAALVPNSKLTSAAQEKADDMIAENYFAHTSPAGATPWHWIDKENYDYNFAGENLAMDFQSAEKMEEAWMESPTHRANILSDKYKDVGVAVKEGMLGGHETILAVVMFGSGDKNPTGATEAESETAKPKEFEEHGSIPALPAAETRTAALEIQNPIISSPQPEEVIVGSALNIAGWAEPKSKLAIFDNDKFVSYADTDGEGRFQLLEKNLSEGTHRLALKSGSQIVGTGAEFYVDEEKPEVSYQLFSESNDTNKIFVKAETNKENCTVEFSGQRRTLGRETAAVFPVETGQSSAILRIFDPAGNKNFKQVNIANLVPQENKSIFAKEMASLFSSGNMFDSGREKAALRNNLGLSPRRFLGSELAVGR